MNDILQPHDVALGPHLMQEPSGVFASQALPVLLLLLNVSFPHLTFCDMFQTGVQCVSISGATSCIFASNYDYTDLTVFILLGLSSVQEAMRGDDGWRKRKKG